MIKLASFAIIPMLAATFFTQPEPQRPPALVDLSVGSEVEEQDRQFLDTLSLKDASDRADQEFLANLQARDRLAAAAGREELTVMRAIPIEHASAVTPVARVADPATVDTMPIVEGHEVRRAVAVAPTAAVASPLNLRQAFHQPFVTMIEPEVRPATSPGQRRASILITGDEVVVRSRQN